jgi:AraC-like DNA-binding protein
MSDVPTTGVLYTEHSDLAPTTPVASLWSYESSARGRHRPAVAVNAHGNCEYWLDRSDPLLNTILPGTGVSVIVNTGGPWAAGRSLATSRLLPRACVVGPVTESRILHVGGSVRAVGAAIAPTLTRDVFGVAASELVDRIVPLDEVWARDEVDRLIERLAGVELRRGVTVMRDALLIRLADPRHDDAVGGAAVRVIAQRAGQVAIDAMAARHGLSRQQFARRFTSAAGLPPKLFARITRFQTLVHTMLATDVARWASLPSATGFYDQAHMINEFRTFAGAPPTRFFQPHRDDRSPAPLRLIGRPSEWQ